MENPTTTLIIYNRFWHTNWDRKQEELEFQWISFSNIWQERSGRKGLEPPKTGFSCRCLKYKLEILIAKIIGPNLTEIPSGNDWHNYRKSLFLIGKSTISMAIFQFAMLVITRGYPFGEVFSKVSLTPRLLDTVKLILAGSSYLESGLQPHLVGGWTLPLSKIFVNWNDYSQYMGK